jgi:hypothetical protein
MQFSNRSLLATVRWTTQRSMDKIYIQKPHRFDMKMRLIFLLFLCLSVFPVVSAGILIGQPESIYNIRDVLSVSITLNPNGPANDFLTLDIDCGNESVEIYRSPFDLQAGEKTTIDVIATLSTSLIGSLVGNCNLVANYAGDNEISQSFELTNKLNIDLDFIGGKYNPGEKISLGGLALRKSGGLVDGFIEVNVESLDILLSKEVGEGKFSFNFTLPEDSEAGEHTIKIRIYEESYFGEVSNEGNISETIEISQVLSSLKILVSSQSVFPGGEFVYTTNAYDQSKEIIQGQISLVIYEPGDFVFLEKVINSGDKGSIDLGLNYTPGYWKIEAVTGGLSARKLFYVEEVKEIHSSLINDTLIVTNIGNVRYRGPLEVTIGSAIQVKQIDLDVGETKKFKLFAPDGTYLIGINDGKREVNLGNVLLTGNAIAIEDIRGGFIGSFSQPVIWILIVLILIAIIVYVRVKKSRKKKLVGGATKKISPEKKVGTESVMYGKKENASVIALKLGHEKKGSSYVVESIEKALMTAKSSSGKVYVDGDYRIILFSPSLTKVKNNEMIAVKVAKRIGEILGEHNSRYKEKINFGIGVHRGEIISEIKDNNFKFTTSGNLISRGKGIAQSSNKEVLLSDSIRRIVVNEIKTERVKGKEVWRITRVSNREEHKDFLSRFMHKD